MQCTNIIYYFGAPIFLEDHEIPVDSLNQFAIFMQFINKMVSFILLFAFICLFVIFRCFYPQVYRQKMANLLESSIFVFLNDLNDEIMEFNSNILIEKAPSSPISIRKVQKKTITSALDNRSTSHPSFEMNEVLMLQRGMEIAIRQHDEMPPERTESRETYVCNFNECCCECCCQFWLHRIYYRYFLNRFRRMWKEGEKFFMRQVKCYCFYFLIIGAFVYHPLRHLASFSLNACNQQKINEGTYIFLATFFAILDLMSGTLSFILFQFTVSFLSTRHEFLKTLLFDKGYRARMIYFHFKKAKIFGFLYICLRICYKSAFFNEYPMNDNTESPFALVFFIFMNVFILCSVNLIDSMHLAPIDQDCRILRAHAQYFTIQNTLLKLTPCPSDIYFQLKDFVREYPRNMKAFPFSFEDQVIQTCENSSRSLKEELHIIEKQKFKNVLRNTGYSNYLPFLLLFLLITDIILSIGCAAILLVRKGHPHLYLSHMVRVARIMLSLISLFECTTLPFLIFYCLKKKNFLTGYNTSYDSVLSSACSVCFDGTE